VSVSVSAGGTSASFVSEEESQAQIKTAKMSHFEYIVFLKFLGAR